VTIKGKDILARIEDRKAKAPTLSPGKLYAGITASATSFEAANATTADYPASGTLRIGSECMTYSSRSSSAHGVTFSGVARGTDNTTAATHSTDDAVQECLRYSAARADDVLEDLLTTYGGIPSAWLDTVAWAAEIDDYLSLYQINALITEPTSVSALVSEVQESALIYLWWDERTALIDLKVVRGLEVDPPVLTAEENIIAGSFSIAEKPRERASQAWVYYGQYDPTKGRTDPTNYRQATIYANLESETDELYGEPSIRTVYSRWLIHDTMADTTASKIITRFVDVPSEAKFRMDAKDRGYWVGDVVTISHYLDIDAYGNRRLRNWTIVSAEEVMPGETVEYMAEDTTLSGRTSYVMASGAAAYPGAGSLPAKYGYIGNASGLLSDGSDCARIN